MTSTKLTGAVWRKSSRSNGQSECVELADLTSIVAVRDSKHPNGAALLFTRQAFRNFTENIKQQ